jgi:phosphoribosylglycinamide formyltransferase-1
MSKKRKAKTELNLGFLCSGNGTNLQSILDAIQDQRLHAKACVVISNNSGSIALERARKFGIPTAHISEKTHPGRVDETISEKLFEYEVNLVCLCGYLKKLGTPVLESFPDRILNIHPALLPKFGGPGMYGMRVHETVILAKETDSGPTLHIVNGEYDKGKILAQEKVPVHPNDTPEILSKKVLEKEHEIYWQVLEKIHLGKIHI